MLRTCEGGGAGVTDRSANILIPTLTIAASLRAVFLAPLPKRSWISLAAGAWHAATRTWAAAVPVVVVGWKKIYLEEGRGGRRRLLLGQVRSGNGQVGSGGGCLFNGRGRSSAEAAAAAATSIVVVVVWNLRRSGGGGGVMQLLAAAAAAAAAVGNARGMACGPGKHFFGHGNDGAHGWVGLNLVSGDINLRTYDQDDAASHLFAKFLRTWASGICHGEDGSQNNTDNLVHFLGGRGKY